MDLIIYGLGRWLHIGSGVLWIGLLWYFNLVQVPGLKSAGADGTAAGITKHIAPRALELFRWASLSTVLFGAMIIFFLIVEPHGLARLWAIAKEKLRLWPFPY